MSCQGKADSGSFGHIPIYACALLDGAGPGAGLTWSPEHSDARWFPVDALADVVMPELYKRAIRAAVRLRSIKVLNCG